MVGAGAKERQPAPPRKREWERTLASPFLLSCSSRQCLPLAAAAGSQLSKEPMGLSPPVIQSTTGAGRGKDPRANRRRTGTSCLGRAPTGIVFREYWSSLGHIFMVKWRLGVWMTWLTGHDGVENGQLYQVRDAGSKMLQRLYYNP